MQGFRVRYGLQAFNVNRGERLLDAATRQGVDLGFSCKGGACHACLKKCIGGDPGLESTRGLSPLLATQGYFLPCICQPQGDLEVIDPCPEDFECECLVSAYVADSLGATLDLELMAVPPGLRVGIRLSVAVGDHVFEGVVVGLPEEHFYLKVRIPPVSDAQFEAMRTESAPGRIRVLPIEDAGRIARGGTHPCPDPDLWDEIGAQRVRAALETFYDQVFSDNLLKPFFHGVTKERVIGKQYSFMEKLMTGNKVYFGDNPRNAHHWMIIPDALFDHRESLMVNALKMHGVSDGQVKRWVALEEFYREDLVKSKGFPRVLDGVAQPLDGFDRERLEVGSLCDHCGSEVAAGEIVLFHRRLGTISCQRCSNEVN